MTQAAAVTGVVCEHGEGPVWSAAWPGLRWVAMLADEDGTVHTLGELWADPSVRMNDGGCDPDGRFYCGSMLTTAPRAGAACTAWIPA